MNEHLENVSEAFEHLAHTALGHKVIHHVAEDGLEAMGETIGNVLDLDDDGSISDTLPDLIVAGADFISSLFS